MASDDFLPSAIHFYNELQEETKVDFFSSIKIRRFFASEQEKKYWTQKQDNPSYVKYLANPDEGHYPYSTNKHKLGSGIVKCIPSECDVIYERGAQNA